MTRPPKRPRRNRPLGNILWHTRTGVMLAAQPGVPLDIELETLN